MPLRLKNLVFNVTFNSCLFLILIIGIQNSSKKSSINLLIDETVNLPISFIIGSSFISGSIIGSILSSNSGNK
ncbi:conserved hypothetical protein [Prochlorococcus marinus subsp. pastoris str. CCMP1986]|uniref:Uncharacterized protein n=1 Tax=Prochlorococcus marinus subsp. pastoris (strain CCMP1986 / NIES-2087 / MED4) TaxID=59919 RepID=Q7V0R2_PROMP|nr:hypothetical protein [Prochlorococcus marinus]KGF87246.1 hypothetical protein PROCH_0834 [Prochlorococcus marinus str. EQPAC1]CAE19653.1 conserved hypothetical protein [Prochlorococcus marinus subsp. pastoris str. CCMP1986]